MRTKLRLTLFSFSAPSKYDRNRSTSYTHTRARATEHTHTHMHGALANSFKTMPVVCCLPAKCCMVRGALQSLNCRLPHHIRVVTMPCASWFPLPAAVVLTDVMYLNDIMTLALFFVTMRIYRSLCRRYMKVHEPSVRTGACVPTEVSLLLSICVLKFSAMSRLQHITTTWNPAVA